MSDFVEYEEALALKELGFNGACFRMSKHRKSCENKIDGSCPLHNIHCGYPDCEIDKTIEPVSLPTYSQAFRFIRKSFKIYHKINLHDPDDELSWRFQLDYCIGSGEIFYIHPSNPSTYFKSYEEAETACLKKFIEKFLENIKKNLNGGK